MKTSCSVSVYITDHKYDTTELSKNQEVLLTFNNKLITMKSEKLCVEPVI